eukprot:m.152806 g.152806  ORF g.152806 m.152806 type:complete len:422 (+) comp16221_c1_seq1:606-1871(+)
MQLSFQQLTRQRSPIQYTSRSPMLRSPIPKPPDFNSDDDEDDSITNTAATTRQEEPSVISQKPTYCPFDVTLKAGLASLTAIPVCFLFNWANTHLDSSGVFLFGLIILLGYPLMLGDIFHDVPERDIFLYVFGLFSFTSVVDFFLAFTIDQRTSLLSLYLERGEPYFKTGYGFAANLWDGTAHWVLYMIMIYGLVSRNPALYRPFYLYWTGSIIFSLCVILPSAAIGCFSHEIQLSAFLNVPFVILPLFFLKRIVDTPRPVEPALRGNRFVDATFVIGLVAAMFVVALRFATASDSKLEYAVNWQSVEPTLREPSKFFVVTSILGLFYVIPALSVIVICMLVGASRAQRSFCADLAVILAGGIAQTQFSYIVASFHHLTEDEYRADPNNLKFWVTNLGLIFIVHAVAYYLNSRRGLAGILP